MTISSVSFVKGNWRFYFDGNQISAKIMDRIFLDKVDKMEEEFSKGDTLDVILNIKDEIDETINTVKKKYKVMHIIEHVRQKKRNDNYLF